MVSSNYSYTELKEMVKPMQDENKRLKKRINSIIRRADDITSVLLDERVNMMDFQEDCVEFAKKIAGMKIEK
jgi:hypothetical protein